MALFGNLNKEGLEESQDRLGGGFILETDIHTGLIKMAYALTSKGGARGVYMEFDFNGKSYRETFYVTNKKGDNFFMAKDKSGKETGKKSPLPGFTFVDDICLVTCDKGLAEMDDEEKVVSVYDPDLKKEVNKSMPVLVELLGKTVSLAIWKQIEDKNVSDGNGGYVPSGETRETNVTDKVFHTETKMTTVVAREKREAQFWDKWLEANKGKVRDRSTKDASKGGAPGARAPQGGPPAAGANGAAQPRKSLFS